MVGTHPCLRCLNFIEKAEHQSCEFGKCKAYPNGIPYEVFAYMDFWNKPIDCNNGIGFEPKENTDKPSE